MKTLLIWLVIVLCVVGIGYAMHCDPGYVLIAYHHMSVEMTLWFGLVALIVGLIVLRLVWGLLAGIVGLPSYFRQRHLRKAAVKSQILLQKGLLDAVTGGYQDAAAAFKKGAKYQEKPLVNYLGGAFALQYQGDQQASEQLLERALKKMPENSEAIYLMQAQLYLNCQCYAKALAVLKKIAEKNQSQNLWVQLAMQCYMGLADWSKAYQLYPKYVKNKTLVDVQIQATYQSIVIGCLGSLNLQQLDAFWASLPKSEKQKEAYVWLLADRYIELDQSQQAANAIMQQLKIEFSEDLWELLATCVSAQSQAILSFCQKQLRHHKDQWVISYCAALAELEQGDLNQAKAYLTQSIQLKPTEHALLVLADIYNQQGLADDFHQTCLQLLSMSSRTKKHVRYADFDLMI